MVIGVSDTLYDREGREIKPGDIVEFYFGADYDGNGTSSPVETDDAPTRMVDFVKAGGPFGLSFICPGVGGAYGFRFARHCKVIGRLPEDRHLFPAWTTDEELDPKNYD